MPGENRGFWGWLERQFVEFQTNPRKRQRWFVVAWYVSLAFTAVGFAVIFVKLAGRA